MSAGYEFQVGDRVSFTERVHPKVKGGVRYDHGSGKLIGTPDIPQQIVSQRGEGTVVRGLRQLKVGERKVTTLKVDAGKPLGIILIVADDAVLTAKPLALDLGIAPIDPQAGPSIYTSDAKGIA